MSTRVVTTEWSQVLAARDGSATEARAALEYLCQTYWQPVYSYIRHQGSDPDEASDLTQAFFTELLEKDFLADVDPAKGRFRAFLLATVRNFLSHQRDYQRAQKRGGGKPTLSLDLMHGETGYARKLADEMTPADVFEYRWAITVLERAVDRLRQEAATSGSSAQFEQLQQYLTSGELQAPYREVALALGTTESAIKSAVQRLRKRLGQCLRSEIAATVECPAQIADEVRYLLSKVRP